MEFQTGKLLLILQNPSPKISFISCHFHGFPHLLLLLRLYFYTF